MKKMRKLIPALSMLLVATIMLSTATFAWFTMNENVTASGMQIKAEATGSLVIKENSALIASDTKTTVNFTSGVAKLKPVTLSTAGVWSHAVKTSNVDPHTGKNTGALTTLDPTINEHYVEKVLFIASAGAELTNQKLTINLIDDAHPADSLAYKAYSAAIYVVEYKDGAWANPALTEKPNAIINLGITTSAVLTKEGGYTIPSVAGIENDSAAVGIKVVVRFFVDGDLNADGTDTMTISQTVKHESKTGALLKYEAGKNYFNEDGTPFNDYGYTVGADLPVGVYYNEYTTTTTTDFKYVNSDDVPVAYSEVSLTISSSSNS
jgi:hypothetical protein